MKTICRIKYLLLTVTLISFIKTQATDLDDCRNLIRFYYVDQPNAAINNSVLLNNQQIADGTETGTFWSNVSIGRAQALVKALLKDPQNGGDASLQFYSATILKIINKPVAVYIYNDVTSKLTDAAAGFWNMCKDKDTTLFYAWPCAINQSISDDYSESWAKCKGTPVPARQDGTWAGTIHLGAYHLNANTLQWAKGTFVHELVHTQDLSDGRMHLFYVNGANFNYGFDQTHYNNEAIPNLAMTFKEGIANTITLLYEGTTAQDRFTWFSNNNLLWVEINPNPANTGVGNMDKCITALAPSPDAWLYNKIIKAGGKEISKSEGYASFKVRDLPAQYIIHNEFILAMIFSEYVRHVSFPRFMDALKSSNNELFRVSASGIAILFSKMCDAGLPFGESLIGVSQSGRQEPKKYLLPLAFADYFTSYRSTTKDEFKSLFENMLPGGWIDLYWETEKQNVRTSVPIKTPKWDDLTSIAIALGITQSLPY